MPRPENPEPMIAVPMSKLLLMISYMPVTYAGVT